MGKYQIVFDRNACIGAGACIAMNSAVWEMQPDGKVIPKMTEFDEAELKKNMGAAQVCPVNAIHLVEKETGKKLI
jgi:ferredoxin